MHRRQHTESWEQESLLWDILGERLATWNGLPCQTVLWAEEGSQGLASVPRWQARCSWELWEGKCFGEGSYHPRGVGPSSTVSHPQLSDVGGEQGG